MVAIARTILNALPRVTHGARLHIVPKLATPVGSEAIALGDGSGRRSECMTRLAVRVLARASAVTPGSS